MHPVMHPEYALWGRTGTFIGRSTLCQGGRELYKGFPPKMNRRGAVGSREPMQGDAPVECLRQEWGSLSSPLINKFALIITPMRPHTGDPTLA